MPLPNQEAKNDPNIILVFQTTVIGMAVLMLFYLLYKVKQSFSPIKNNKEPKVDQKASRSISENLLTHSANKAITFGIGAGQCTYYYNSVTLAETTSVPTQSCVTSQVKTVHERNDDDREVRDSLGALNINDDFRQKAIYTHLPVEVYHVRFDPIERHIQSVAAIVPKSFLDKSGKNYIISSKAQTLSQFVQKRYFKPLAPSQAYHDQYAIAVGTAFLGNNKCIITAGHCVYGKSINDYYVVFNFHGLATEQAKTTFNESDIYLMRKVIAVHDFKGSNGVHEMDWAVVELNRSVSGNIPIPKRSKKPPKKDTVLYTIGHPCGLPAKVDIAAQVTREVAVPGSSVAKVNHHLFFANLNTFCGNSGSPVFNMDTHEVEGILVNGQDDFEVQGNCVVFKTHSIDQCFIHMLSDLPEDYTNYEDHYVAIIDPQKKSVQDMYYIKHDRTPVSLNIKNLQALTLELLRLSNNKTKSIRLKLSIQELNQLFANNGGHTHPKRGEEGCTVIARVEDAVNMVPIP